jgi:hypothetical protein
LLDILLSYNFTKFLEVVNEFLIVELLVYVEPVPKVAADDNASETKVLGYTDCIDVHAAQGIDVPVDEAPMRGFFQFCLGE